MIFTVFNPGNDPQAADMIKKPPNRQQKKLLFLAESEKKAKKTAFPQNLLFKTALKKLRKKKSF